MKKHLQKILIVLFSCFIGLICFTACSKPQYKVNFIVDDAVYATIESDGEELLVLPNDPAKDGYSFDGWYRDKGIWQKSFSADSLLNEKLSGDISVYAKFDKITYKVNFIVDDAVYATIKSNGEELLVLPNAPAKDGYSFDGWYRDKGVWQKSFSADSLLNEKLSGDISVYAKFNKVHIHSFSEQVIEPTCLEQGYTLYVCICGETYKDNFKEPVGHNWGEPVYTWSSGYSSCTAQRVCKADAQHIESETVTSVRSIRQARSCVLDELSVYTAVFKNPVFKTQIKDNIKTAEKGHTFNQKIVADKYLCSNATCTHKATYYLSCVCGEKGTSTFENGDFLPHNFEKKVVNSRYLFSKATCTQKAKYYYSCECGERGLTTFEYGNLLPHTYDQKVESSQYLYSEATDDTNAVYYYSCICGAKGSQTFEHTEKIKIIIDINGGVSKSNVTSKIVSNKLLPSDLFYDITKSNSKFIGWSLNGELIISGDGQVIRRYDTYDGMKLVATYKNTCKLTIKKTGNGYGSVSGDGEYYYFEQIDLYAYPDDGYKFSGWVFNGKTISRSRKYTYKMEESDRVIEAVFTINTYAVRIASNSSDDGLVSVTSAGMSNTVIYTKNAYLEGIPYKNSVTIAAYSKTTTRFLGWFDGENNLVSLDPVYTFEMPGYNRSFVAKWNESTVTDFGYYFIDYDLNGGENYYNNPTSATAGNLTLQAPEKAGYDFDGWSTTYITKDTTIVAKWRIASRTIKYNLDGGTNNSENPKTFTITSGMIVLQEPTKKGYRFIGWTGTNLPVPCKSVEINSQDFKDYEFTANWQTAIYSITYRLNGGINDSRNIKKYEITDDNIGLYAPKKNYYTFIGWELNGQIVSEIDCDLGADIVLEAKWTPEIYTITYNIKGGTIGANDNPAEYTIETSTFTLNVPTKRGYRFLGWMGSNGNVPRINVVIETGTHGNLSYTANWEIITYTITYELNGGENNLKNDKISYTIEDANIHT